MSSGVVSEISSALQMMSASNVDKKPALNYLENFQKQPQAWEVTTAILSNSESPVELQMFAAQTLRNKMTYDLSQLPQEALPGLKDSIIQFLIQYSAVNKPITTQLSIALAKLTIQYMSWSNAVEEITAKLADNIPALLEFLKILPEESLDPKGTPLTDEEFKLRTEELIVSNVNNVLALLSKFSTNSTNSHANSLILDCLNSWIKEIPVENLLTIQPLTNVLFESLKDEESFEKSIECLCSITRETRDIDNIELIKALYQQIIQLKPLLNKYNDDPDVFGSLARLFVECGESWHMLIGKFPDFFSELVEIILIVSSYDEDLDIVKYTFYFWYIFKQVLTTERYKVSKIKFQPIYNQLIHVMIKHLKYPDGDETQPLFSNKEEEEKFKDFRYEMGDVLKDCTAVIGSAQALIIPYNKIQEALSQTPIKWQDVESPLFSLRAMAKEVKLTENEVLPKIMDLLIQLPENTKIRYSATLVLGRYTEWTNKHPEFLEKQLNYIINGFQNSNNEIITAASHSLMYFCQDCSELLTNYIEQLYNFYINIFDNLSTLDLIALYEITEGISHVIKTQSKENITQVATMFLTPILNKLNGYLSINESEINENIFKSIADEVEIVRIYFEVLIPKDFNPSVQDPIANLVIEIWPIIKNLIEKFGKSLKVSERCMKFTKTILQTYNIFLIPILPSIAETIVTNFQKTEFGCYLWVSGILIREFGDETYVSASIKDSVWQFAYQQIVSFLTIFKNTKTIDIPDLIEDYSSMMSDIMMYFVTNFTLSDILKPTFDTAVLALNIEKVEPLSKTLQFLIDLVSWGFNNPPISIFEEIPEQVKLTIKQFINENGGSLILALINGLIFKFPNQVTNEAIELIDKTIKLAPNNEIAINWIAVSIDSLPKDTVSTQEREKLLKTASTSLNSKDYRRLRMGIKDFVSWYTRKNITPRFSN